MDIQYFITFREVARCQNLTRAAERLGYAQPTISVQVQKLESHFQAKLFERNSKKLKLTDEGVRLLGYADQIVESYRSALEGFTSDKDINVTIGTTETLAAFFLPPYFQAFRNKFENANVMFFPVSDQEIVRRIKCDELDMGIVLDTPVMDPELITITVRKEELIFICHKEHPLHGRRGMMVDDLKDSSFILTEKGCRYRSALEKTMNDNGISYKIVSEMGSLEGIKQCVLYGMGIAMIPKIAANELLQTNQLAGFSMREDVLSPFYTQIIMHKNKHMSVPIQYLISLLTSRESGG